MPLAIAGIINGVLTLIRSFTDNDKRQGLVDLIRTAVSENRDVSSAEVEAVIDDAQEALDDLDNTIEDREG